jgi:hypothetical protein
VEDAEVVEELEIAGLQVDVERGGFSREVQSVERKVLLLCERGDVVGECLRDS